MIDYKTFKETIDVLKKQYKVNQKRAEAFKIILPHDHVTDIDMPIYDYFVNFLMKVMNDESEWIAYYVYELDFGLLNDTYKVTDKKGKEIPLKTTKDLWNILKVK